MNSNKAYQVITRGVFGPLDAKARETLLGRAEDHDLLNARFTKEGTITYDRSLRTFSFRVLVPAREDTTEHDILRRAEHQAVAAVHQLGATAGDLRSAATDMSSITIRRRR